MRKNKLLAMAVSAVLSLTMCLSACASDDEAGTGGIRFVTSIVNVIKVCPINST